VRPGDGVIARFMGWPLWKRRLGCLVLYLAMVVAVIAATACLLAWTEKHPPRRDFSSMEAPR
jgi:hypothetical protein